MAKSKCTKCEGNAFEIAEVKPINSEIKVAFIQCANCGSVLAAVDQYDVGFFVKEIAKRFNILPQLEE